MTKLSDLPSRLVDLLDKTPGGKRGRKLGSKDKKPRKGRHEMVKHPYQPGEGVCKVCGFLHADRIHAL